MRRSGGVFHVWFHPENLYAEWRDLKMLSPRFLEELGTLARNGALRCLTMGQLAGEFKRKLAFKQGCDLSPAYTEPGYVNCAPPCEVEWT